MILQFLKRTLNLGIGRFWADTAGGIRGFWADPQGWVFIFPVIIGIENNCNPPPIITDTPSTLLDYWWIFVLSGELIFSTLLATLLKKLCGSLRENWNQNGFLFMLEYSWVILVLQSIRKHVMPSVLSCRIFDDMFTTLPKSLRNYEAKMLSTLNALSITFNIFFSVSFNW